MTELAFFELTEWILTLEGGEKVTIMADSRSEEDGEHVFFIALAGKPLVLRPVARVPMSLVSDISTDVGRTKPPGEVPGE
jgi:hypothetical protein